MNTGGFGGPPSTNASSFDVLQSGWMTEHRMKPSVKSRLSCSPALVSINNGLSSNGSNSNGISRHHHHVSMSSWSKERWFVLTPHSLNMYDKAEVVISATKAANTSAGKQGGGGMGKGCRKEKGCILMKDVSLVECVHSVNAKNNNKFIFQIGYEQPSNGGGNCVVDPPLLPSDPTAVVVVSMMYVEAKSEMQREKWIHLIRQAAYSSQVANTKHKMSNKLFQTTYHPLFPLSTKYPCCEQKLTMAVTNTGHNINLSKGSSNSSLATIPSKTSKSSSSTQTMLIMQHNVDGCEPTTWFKNIENFKPLKMNQSNDNAMTTNISVIEDNKSTNLGQNNCNFNELSTSSPTSSANQDVDVNNNGGMDFPPPNRNVNKTSRHHLDNGNEPVLSNVGAIVAAVYPFNAIEEGDLTLEIGHEYIVLDDTQEHWWKIRNSVGEEGFIPSNYIRIKTRPPHQHVANKMVGGGVNGAQPTKNGLRNFDWFVGDMSRQRTETLLKTEDREGNFVVRNSSTKGFYTLSLYTKTPNAQVKHYHIKQQTPTSTSSVLLYYLSEKHCCASIPELVEYHSYNAGGLACRLKALVGRSNVLLGGSGSQHHQGPSGLPSGTTKWEIDPQELTLLEELGSGQFGFVRRGKWKRHGGGGAGGAIDVAVKMMKEGTMSEDEFIEEAQVMTRLQHINLVQLYGVCSKDRPIFIVAEFMKHGSLLHYLRRLKPSLMTDTAKLLDIIVQVCRGMAYLERHNYIHRDLAARNCLVGSENIVKVADFGLTRYVIDDQYTSNGGAKFPIKWSPPEVLNYTRFSSKSDVWAFGVLCWEVFTCGDMPYGRAKNPEVVDRVQRGQILSQPVACPFQVYEVMQSCWQPSPETRPPFRNIKEELLTIMHVLQLD